MRSTRRWAMTHSAPLLACRAGCAGRPSSATVGRLRCRAAPTASRPRATIRRRGRASALAPKPCGEHPHLFDGIGVALGALDDGRHLVGVDLDGCRDPETGAIKPWAQEVIADFASYTEISPSGTGAKIYATCDSAPALAGNKIVIAERPGEHHHEQIEVFTNGRYFAFTGQPLADAPDKIANATAPMARMAERLAAAKDAKLRSGINGKAAPLSGDLPRAFLNLLEQDAPLASAWHGAVKLGRGGDTSASGLDWSLAQHLGPHLDDADLAAVLRCYRHGQIGGGALVGNAAERRPRPIARPPRPSGGGAKKEGEGWPPLDPSVADPLTEPAPPFSRRRARPLLAGMDGERRRRQGGRRRISLPSLF